jgi:hypothetical protein
MTLVRGVAAMRNLRAQPLWRLLAADKSVVVICVLRYLLTEHDKALVASALYERLGRVLDELRAAGEELPQTTQAYVADWLAQGWLTRKLPTGASEEQYELSAEAAAAIRFASSLLTRRTLATESRLSTVMQQLIKLAEETDTNPHTRITALMAERERIDREIETVRTHGATALPHERALERAREIIALADELTADFRRVHDDFDQLNRELRQSLMEYEGSRGDVLESVFAGVDVIGESDAGKTFAAFWRLLTDPEQSEALHEALDTVVQRPFAGRLEKRERKFLVNLTALLTDEGSSVHDVLQSFARSLKNFVQSREFLEQRRLHSLLKQATQAALAARARLRPTQDLDYALSLTNSRIRSVSQWLLYDPAGRVVDANMRAVPASEIDLALVSEMVRQSEIDFRTLRRNVRSVLEERTQASVAQVLQRFPAEQGLGSVVGYLALGVKHGERGDQIENVSWRGNDTVLRRARVPTIYFVRERYDELVD